MPAFSIFTRAMKKLLFLCLLLVAVGAKAQTHYFTMKVTLAFKNKTLLQRMSVDVGKDQSHPLHNKVANTEGDIVRVIQADGKELLFNNEVDLLNYFENNGWDLVSVNEVMVLNDHYLQYLFKSE